MAQTLIWSNTNDSHNEAVIIREIADLKKFVPKVATKAPIIDADENVEVSINASLVDDYSSDSIMTLINKQYAIGTFLMAKFKPQDSNKIIWAEYKTYLQWIYDTSVMICTKFNLQVEHFTNNDVVQRSSYKFCTNGARCIPVYKDIMKYNNKLCSCTGDHFIHNKIVRDLRNLFSVLDADQSKLYQDLRLGLNTLNFVLGHIKTELSTFNFHLSKSDSTFNINQFYKNSIANSVAANNANNRPSKYNRHKKRK